MKGMRKKIILSFLVSVLCSDLCEAQAPHTMSDLHSILNHLQAIQEISQSANREIDTNARLRFDWTALAADIHTVQAGIQSYTEYPPLSVQILPLLRGDYLGCQEGQHD
jgi:RAQPRD family integrative conjugative element protein